MSTVATRKRTYNSRRKLVNAVNKASSKTKLAVRDTLEGTFSRRERAVKLHTLARLNGFRIKIVE